MVERRAFTLAGVVAVLFLLLAVPGSPAASAVGGASAVSLPSPSASPGPAVSALGSGAVASAHDLPPASLHAPLPASWNNSTGCQNRLANYLAYYGPTLPTDVVHTEQTPCYIGHDEPALNFVSNASYSGSRVQFVIALPPAGTNTASAFATMWVGLWLAGVPCSYRGQSYLEVQLNPPDNVLGLTPNPNWTVQAPVWDLVPPGSCDPQCQNDTAFATVGGLPYCEDDAAIRGVGTYTSTGWGNFAPGDTLVVQLVGAQGGASGLSVYLNDTTHPAASLNWSYGGSVTTDGLPLTPFYNASGFSDGGWGYGLNVAATWENCPEPTGYDYPSACNSYNGPAVNAVDVPRFLSATYWNASTQSYADPYPWTATTSSAGACSGLAAPCQDFSAYGGTSSYPSWSLHAFGGQAWWTYGGTYPDQVNGFGGSANQFTPEGFIPVNLDPTSLFNVTNVTVGNTFSLTAAAADPNGVQKVEMTAFFCFAFTTATAQTKTATLTVSPYDTPEDGNWSATFSTGTYSGTLYYEVRALSSGGVWSEPVFGSRAIVGVTACSTGVMAAPGFSVANVTAVAGGLDLTWNASLSPGVIGYSATFNATVNGTPFTLEAGNTTRLAASLGLPNTTFVVEVSAEYFTGYAHSSAPVPAPATLPLLTVNFTAPTSTIYWVGQATSVPFVASVTGGLGPFTYTFIFGDGTNATVTGAGTTASTTHDYAAYYGNARASVEVTDALGDAVVSGRALIQVWATPLGVPQSIAAGDGVVRVSWAAPASPVGAVTGYTVYYSENPTWAPFMTETWPYNYTPYDLHLWNTTQTSLDVSVPDGVPLYAQVVAWNAHGEGLLPVGSPLLVGVPAPFVVSPIQVSAGGPAPYSATVSAFITNGTNDALLQAVYTSGTTVVIANSTVVPGGVYVNASVPFTTPGAHLIVLHASDLFFNIGIQIVSVYVAPGAGPTVALTPPTANGWFGWPASALALTASATGGLGPYTYAWAFGDGATATGANVSHAYLRPGNYTIVVETLDTTTGGVTVSDQPIEIYALPAVYIQATPGPNGSLSVDLTAFVNGGSGAAKITWSFGDGSTTTGAVVSHDYASAGTYTVNATATDPTGKTGSTSLTLTLSTPAAGGAGGGTFLGAGASTLGVLLLAVTALALLLLLGTVYFWSRARARPIVMAPEPPRPPSSPPS